MHYHAEIEYDLLSIGVDVLGFWTGQLSPRRLRVLLDHLPRTSAFKAALIGGPHFLPEQILADIYDLLAIVNTPAKRGRPKPYPRAGDELRQERERAEQVARLKSLSRLSAGGAV